MSVLTFPQERPEDSPAFLWSLQLQLLQEVEARLGTRDPDKKVYQPTFSDANPHIINTPSLDGAFAELSRNAAGFWPTAVYELAHETVHLLNPIAGNTIVLEEGMAETFAIEMAETLGGQIIVPSLESYAAACGAVKKLAGDVFGAGKKIRENCGALSRATPAELSLLFQEVDSALLDELSAQFQRE